jgi:hypothetical protein
MKEMNRESNEVEQRLKRARLAEPSAELKARIVGAARETWAKAPADIPWRIPLRHLALSTAAAVLIMALANLYGDQLSAPRLHPRPSVVCRETVDLDTLAEVPVDCRIVGYAHSPPSMFAQWESVGTAHPTLLDYAGQVRQTLKETEQDGMQQEPITIPHGSGRLSDRQNRYA